MLGGCDGCPHMAERFTDMLTYVLSVALAAGVMAFAAYKVIKLNNMEDPPANMGLNFPAAKRKVIIEETPATTDPLTTESVAPARAGSGTGPGSGRSASPRVTGPAQSYQLLAVVDGVAFVEVGLARGKMLVPVTVGTVLPGGVLVEGIERRDGRWRLVAGNLRIEQAADALQ